MSGRTYRDKEVVQWGYVALVCVALAFTMFTKAMASTKSGIRVPPHEITLGVCTVRPSVGETPERRACETGTERVSDEPVSSLLGSTFANTSVPPYSVESPRWSPTFRKNAE